MTEKAIHRLEKEANDEMSSRVYENMMKHTEDSIVTIRNSAFQQMADINNNNHNDIESEFISGRRWLIFAICINVIILFLDLIFYIY